MNTFQRHLITPLIVAAFACMTSLGRPDEDDVAYKQTNVAPHGAAPAKTPDMKLKNPWGIAAFPGGPFWIADNGMGVATLYDGHGNIVPLTVKIPPPKGSAPGTQ